MDWNELETDIYLNEKYNDVENDLKIIYGKPVEIQNYENYVMSFTYKKIEERLRYIFNLNAFPFYDFNKFIKGYVLEHDMSNEKNILNENIKIKHKNNIYFVNDYIIIPLVKLYTDYSIEAYVLCNYLNIKNLKNVLIYHEKFDYFYNTIKDYFVENNVFSYNKDLLELKNNYYDIFFVGAYDVFNMLDCNWFSHKVNYYIMLLIQMTKYLKNNSICIIAYDFKNFSIDIYNQILILYSCFMNIRIVTNKLIGYPKCYIIGENINIDKLNEFYKKNTEIFKIKVFTNSFRKDEDKKTCIAIHNIIINLNLKNNFIFEKNINLLKNKYLNLNKKINDIITDNNISTKTIMKTTIKNIYKYIISNKIPIEFNNYYLDKPDKFVFSVKQINKIYFPNILNVNMRKLKLTPQALYSVTYPYEAEKITNIIYNITGNGKIIDACANVGGNTISFSQKFRKVISIELDKNNYEALKKNIKNYKLENVKVKNMDCLEYIKNHKFDIIFFDPPWGGNLIYTEKKVTIKLSNININDIIKNILKEKPNVKIFMKVPINFYSDLKKEIFKIKNYQLLYFYN